MFYRRKILLALLEAFGGKLGRTDCQKLLMLFCKQSGTDHYEFFPYKYGCFSFLSYTDKIRLCELGRLKDADDFELRVAGGCVDALRPRDRLALRSFTAEFSGLRGKKLIRHTYVHYPWYASRSEILRDVLAGAELERAESYFPRDANPCLFTIGYEGVSIDGYLNRLISSNIRLLIDVRQNPLSRKHGFSKKQLKGYVEKAGLGYVHLPGLGIPSLLRRDLEGDDSYRELLDLYEAQILPDHKRGLDEIRQLVSTHSRVALTCFEA